MHLTRPLLPRAATAALLLSLAGPALSQGATPGTSGLAPGRIPDEAVAQPGTPKPKRDTTPTPGRSPGQNGQAPGVIPVESAVNANAGPARRAGAPTPGRCPGQSGQAPGTVPPESAVNCPPDLARQSAPKRGS